MRQPRKPRKRRQALPGRYTPRLPDRTAHPGPGPRLRGGGRARTYRSGTARLSPVRFCSVHPAQPGAAPQASSAAPASLTGGAQRRPAPCLRRANHRPVWSHGPAHHPAMTNHRAVLAAALPRGAAPASRVPRNGRGFLPSRPRPASLRAPSRCACAFGCRGRGRERPPVPSRSSAMLSVGLVALGPC